MNGLCGRDKLVNVDHTQNFGNDVANNYYKRLKTFIL